MTKWRVRRLLFYTVWQNHFPPLFNGFSGSGGGGELCWAEKALFRWYLNTDCWRPRHPDYWLNLQGSVAHGLKISAFGWKYNLLLFPRQIDRFKIWFWIFLLCLRGKQKQKRDFFLRRKIDKVYRSWDKDSWCALYS